jgi:hypothetical protein
MKHERSVDAFNAYRRNTPATEKWRVPENGFACRTRITTSKRLAQIRLGE